MATPAQTTPMRLAASAGPPARARRSRCRSRSWAAPPPWRCRTPGRRCPGRSGPPAPGSRPGGSSPPGTGTSSPAAWTWRPAAAAPPGRPFAGDGLPRDGGMADLLAEAASPGAAVRGGGVRGHRAVRPGRLQRAEAGEEAVPAGDPAVRHRRARRHRRRQRHHRPGPPGQAGRRGMAAAADQGENLERPGRALPGRLEHRPRPLRLPGRPDPAPRPGQSLPGPDQDPPGPGPASGPRWWSRSSPGGSWTSSACPPSPPGSTPTRPATPHPPGRAGPPRPCGPCWATPSTPGTWSTAASATATAAASPSRRPSGCGHPSPSIPAIVDRAVWEAAQEIAAGHGTSRDGTAISRHPAAARTYPYRGRVRCRDCRRRMGASAYAAQRLLPVPPQPGQPPPRRRFPGPPPHRQGPRPAARPDHRPVLQGPRLRRPPRRSCSPPSSPPPTPPPSPTATPGPPR